MPAVNEQPIYLDYNATTPIAPEVLDAMLPVLRDGFGNPSSSHAYGNAARALVGRAREQVAALLDCSPGEVIFTSGGTESNNAALIGIAEATRDKGRHLVTSAIEHPAVAATCGYLERRGWEVTRIGVDHDGEIGLNELADAVRPETTLISIMHANNETGVLQPIEDVRESIAPLGAILHTDAAQSVGKVDCRVDRLGVDALTLAGRRCFDPRRAQAVRAEGRRRPVPAPGHAVRALSARRESRDRSPCGDGKRGPHRRARPRLRTRRPGRHDAQTTSVATP